VRFDDSVNYPHIELFDITTLKSYTLVMSKLYCPLIKKLRLERGWSQLEVAERLEISRSSYIAFEQGKRELTFGEAEVLSQIFDISFEDIRAGKVVCHEVMQTKSNKNETKPVVVAEDRISVPQERVEKFKQVLLYILLKIGGKPNVGQTTLYKILYFIDFDYYEKYDEQLIGARYIKNTHGPTPVIFAKIIQELEESGKLETIKSKFYKYDQTKYLVNPNEAISLTELSGMEIAHIDWELNRLSDMTAAQISALSHKDTPWFIAKDRQVLDYEFVFYRPVETSVGEYDQL